MTAEEQYPEVRLEPYLGSWDDDDPDANFRADVAAYSLADPLATIGNVAAALEIPVGALVRYVLAKWATGGSEALLEVGTSTVQRLAEVVREAESAGTDEARLAAYDTLRTMVEWMAHGVASPETTYPGGGAGRVSG